MIMKFNIKRAKKVATPQGIKDYPAGVYETSDKEEAERLSRCTDVEKVDGRKKAE